MSVFIHGIGTAVPPHRISQRDAAEAAKAFCNASPEQQRLLPALYRRSGVATRHSVILESEQGDILSRQSFFRAAQDAADRGPTTADRMREYDVHAGGLARTAALGAMQEAGISSGDVTHLITVSCTGFSAPGFDFELLKQLGLPATTARTHVGFMGCHGAMNGLRLAQAFVGADPQACVLLCAAELCTLHQQYGWDPDQIVANALFADGAAAVVCRATPPDSGNGFEFVSSGSCVVPETEDAMSWRIGDHGFEMTLSTRVPEIILQHLPEWLAGWLGRFGLTVAEIGSWAIHPGGPRVLAACAESLGLGVSHLSESQGVLSEFGNMSSPTVLFILDRLRKSGAARPCVLMGFGPGITIEAALVR